MGVWTHPHTNENHHFVLCIDEGSRFRIGRVIVSGQRKHVSATQFTECFRSHWTQYFGNPHALRVDPDGSFRRHELSEFRDRNHIFLDLVASEAHWKTGICEQAIKGAKSVMTKLVMDDPDFFHRRLLQKPHGPSTSVNWFADIHRFSTLWDVHRMSWAGFSAVRWGQARIFWLRIPLENCKEIWKG